MIIKRQMIPWQTIEDKVVVIIPAENKVVELNAVASAIWASIDEQGSSVENIVNSITEQFDVDTQQAQLETKEFIEQLQENKLIQVEG